MQAADPVRAITELEGLLESAFDAEIDGGELDDDYLAALVKAVLGISMADLLDCPVDAEELENRVYSFVHSPVDGSSFEKQNTAGQIAIRQPVYVLFFWLGVDRPRWIVVLARLAALPEKPSTEHLQPLHAPVAPHPPF